MVNIGFICEGKSECLLINSEKFRNFLVKIGLNLVAKPIDAKGGGNLLPHNIKCFNRKLVTKGAEIIIILADLETDPCIEKTKLRIQPEENLHQLIIARKKIESWFLSDDKRMLELTKNKYYGNTEILEKPDEVLKELLLKTKKYRALGHSDIAEIIIGNNDNGFDIQNCECESASYFIRKLIQIADSTKVQKQVKNKKIKPKK